MLGRGRVGRGVLGGRPVARTAAVAGTAAVVARGVGRRGIGVRTVAMIVAIGAMIAETGVRSARHCAEHRTRSGGRLRGVAA